MWTDRQVEHLLRFWSYVRITEACWEWTRSTRDGYGRFWFDAVQWTTHRLMWHLTIAPLSLGEPGGDNCICHTCDNRVCVRPSHLFLAAQTQNIVDMVDKGRQRGATGVKNSRAKLTLDQIHEIRQTPQQYGQQICFARRFGVSREQIHRVQAGKNWVSA